MSFSLREKVAEGRMRGWLISFGSSPPHPILLPAGERTCCRLFLVVKSEKVCPGEAGRGSGRERAT